MITPNRSHTGILEVDPADAPRMEMPVEDAVGREREGSLRNAARPPALELAGRAAPLERVGRLEALGHDPIGVGRQTLLQRAAGSVDQEDVVAFLDARRRQQGVLGQHRERSAVAAIQRQRSVETVPVNTTAACSRRAGRKRRGC